MNRIFTLTLLSLITLAAAFADDLGIALNYFKAGFDGTDVKVEWELGSETGVTNFGVERKLSSETAFKKLIDVPVNTTKRYSVIDTDLRNVPNRTGTISYRLTVETSSGNTVFNTSFVNNPSSVERSWGSIKSMFR